MPFEVNEQPKVLIEKLNNIKSAKKNGLIFAYSDENYTYRITLLGYPRESDVYYIDITEKVLH